MKYLIIGNGIAGMEAALTIRKHNREHEITIITESNYLHYNRTKLSEYITSELPNDMGIEELTVYKEDFYEKRDIIDLLHTKIVKIDTKKQILVDHLDHEYLYSKLLIATGGKAILPDINGTDLSGVYTLHGITDANKIKLSCQTSNNYTIAGAGLLGLETAAALHNKGKSVTIIELEDQILAKQLDKESAAFLQNILEQKGLKFILSNKVKEIIGKENIVSEIILANDDKITTDNIIFCIGIEPGIELAKLTNLKCNKGILVDINLKTSAKNIFAAGDSTEYENKNINNWAIAKSQGYVAGLNMLEKETEYNQIPHIITTKIKGIEVLMFGNNSKNEGEILTNQSDNTYCKITHNKSEILSATIINNPDLIKLTQNIINGKNEIKELSEYF